MTPAIDDTLKMRPDLWRRMIGSTARMTNKCVGNVIPVVKNGDRALCPQLRERPLVLQAHFGDARVDDSRPR